MKSATLPSLLISVLLPIAGAYTMTTNATAPDDDVLTATAFRILTEYFNEFRHPQTGVVYGARLSGKKTWTTPADIKAKKPQPWGYGSRIEDTALHCGHVLGALIDAYEAKPDPFLAREARTMFSALKFIYSRTPVPGLVPRGPHPDDDTAVYDDSSMDQHTTFIIALAMFANSALATADDKAYVAAAVTEVGKRLEGFGWQIRRADGITQSHVGFAWTGMVHEHASILLPTLRALYTGSRQETWRELYERFGNEQNGLRWSLLTPGPQVKINEHPIYANQNCFRLHALYRFEDNPKHRAIIASLLSYAAEIQLARDYPNTFLTSIVKADWPGLAKECRWDGTALHGAADAWKRFTPAFMSIENVPLRGQAMLAHIRFPLGGYHMALLSEDDALKKSIIGDVWDMVALPALSTIDNGEIRYLRAVAGLYLYTHRFKKPS